MPVACALIPRFRLIAATSGSGETSMKRVAPQSARSTLALPAALAPEPGAAQLIGEVSEPAERFGLRAGMRMGEALSRCPELALIPPDPERAERSWEEALRRLEGIGAQVESGLAGEAFFEAGGPGPPLGGVGGGAEPGRPPPRSGRAPARP